MPPVSLINLVMKMKVFRKISIIFIAVLLLFSSMLLTSAETYYELYGYTYTIVSNDYISLTGWDNSSSTLLIPDSLAGRYFLSIANWAFENNKEITSVDFSQAQHLNRIGMNAFSGCSNIESELQLPNSVTVINDNAFSYCSSLPSVTINSRVSVLPENCFLRCTSLKSVTLPDTLEKISNNSFSFCTSLDYIEIPSKVSTIEEYAFYGDENLVLGVYKNSYGLQYAEENEIDHIILDGDKTGDVNGDGVVDILDATEIQKYAAESTDFTDEQFELGDINKDGYCDVIDALLVQKSVIGAYEIPPIVIRY